MPSKLLVAVFVLAFGSSGFAADPALERVANDLKVSELRSVCYSGLGMDVRPGLQARPCLAQDQAQFVGAHREL